MTGSRKSKTAEDTNDLKSEMELGMFKWELSNYDDPDEKPIVLSHVEIKEEREIVASQSSEDEFLEKETSSYSSDQCSIENEASNNCCKECTSRDAALQNILKQNHLIRVMLIEVLKELQDLKQDTTKKIHGPKISFYNKFPGLKFPLNTEDDIIQFENILSRRENFEDGVHELYRIGGDSSYKFVGRVLRTLVTDNLAMEYSWLGRKGKKNFHKLNIANLVIHAAEKAKIARNKRETEISIQLWLRRARDRCVRY